MFAAPPESWRTAPRRAARPVAGSRRDSVEAVRQQKTASKKIDHKEGHIILRAQRREGPAAQDSLSDLAGSKKSPSDGQILHESFLRCKQTCSAVSSDVAGRPRRSARLRPPAKNPLTLGTTVVAQSRCLPEVQPAAMSRAGPDAARG